MKQTKDSDSPHPLSIDAITRRAVDRSVQPVSLCFIFLAPDSLVIYLRTTLNEAVLDDVSSSRKKLVQLYTWKQGLLSFRNMQRSTCTVLYVLYDTRSTQAPYPCASPLLKRLNLGSVSRRYSACFRRRSASCTFPRPLHTRRSADGP